MGVFNLTKKDDEIKIEYPAQIKDALKRAKQRQMELKAWLYFIGIVAKGIKNMKKDVKKFL